MKKLSLVMTAVIILSLMTSIGAYAASGTETIKVTCVGDSLTESAASDYSTSGNTKLYPTELQRLLGDRYAVNGCGKGGATMYHSRAGYIGTKEYNDSIAAPSDYVVIMLGTNDANNLDFAKAADKELYEKNYKRLLDTYRGLNRNVKIIMMAPPPVDIGSTDLTERNTEIREQVGPFVEELSVKYGCEYIDMYDAIMTAHPTGGVWYDGIHFTQEGYNTIAKNVYDKIMRLETKTDVTADFLTDSTVSVISRDALLGNIFIATYAGNALIDVIDAGNVNIAAEASTIVNTEELEKTGADTICMYVWQTGSTLVPLTEKVPVGIRFEVTDGGIVIKGTSLISAGNTHGILIKDQAGTLVWASEQIAGVNGAYSYTVKLAPGTYTVYTGTGGNSVTETLTVE